jgi:hypothetical protein
MKPPKVNRAAEWLLCAFWFTCGMGCIANDWRIALISLVLWTVRGLLVIAADYRTADRQFLRDYARAGAKRKFAEWRKAHPHASPQDVAFKRFQLELDR